MRNRRTILLTYASLSVALFKLKEDTDPERVKEWQRLAQGMVGKVPGAFVTPSRHVQYADAVFLRTCRVLLVG